MNQKIKFLKLITVSLLIVIGIFIALFIFFPENIGNALSRIGFFDLILGDKNFRTSAEYQKTYDIETANISNEKEKKLNGIIEESIKVQLEYYSTEKDESLDKVKNLYLPEAFDKYKKYVKQQTITNKEFRAIAENKLDIQSYDTIKIIKFSPPRTYKDLPNRIGMINHIEFNNRFFPIFSFA